MVERAIDGKSLWSNFHCWQPFSKSTIIADWSIVIVHGKHLPTNYDIQLNGKTELNRNVNLSEMALTPPPRLYKNTWIESRTRCTVQNSTESHVNGKRWQYRWQYSVFNSTIVTLPLRMTSLALTSALSCCVRPLCEAVALHAIKHWSVRRPHCHTTLKSLIH
jgi:hypothetical protein